MKDFITTIASIMLLMIFLLQFVTNQTIYTRLVAAENAVKEFRLAAEESGKIEDIHIRKIKQNAAEVLGCTAEEISVEIRELTENELKKEGFASNDATEDTANESDDEENQESLYRVFEYRVKLPVRGLVGAAGFLGISEAENSTVHTSKGWIRIAEEPKNEKDEADEASGENKEGADESGTEKGENSSEKGENGDSFEDGKSTEKEHEEYDNSLGNNDTV